MTANPNDELRGYSVEGSNVGTVDLFCAAEGGSAARRSCAAIAVAFESRMDGLPTFRQGIDLDISHAYVWNTLARVPLGIAMTFWFMTEEPTDERVRTWLLNLYRFASSGDCQRTLKGLADKGKMITKTMYAQISSRNQAGNGVVDYFAEDRIFTNVDNFWGDFV